MLHPLYSCVSYLALMINGFISESVWFKHHVFLQYPLGPSILRELPCAPPPLSWRVLLGPLNLALLPRAEGQLGATSNQGHAALGSLRDYWHLLSLSWHTGHWEQRLYGWQPSVRKAKVSQAQPRLQMSPEWSANCLVPWCSAEVEGRIPMLGSVPPHQRLSLYPRRPPCHDPMPYAFPKGSTEDAVSQVWLPSSKTTPRKHKGLPDLLQIAASELRTLQPPTCALHSVLSLQSLKNETYNLLCDIALKHQ